MRIEASAPGRCGIIGNPTDGYGGCVISCSLVERSHVVLTTPADELSVTVAPPRTPGGAAAVEGTGQTAVLKDRGDYHLKGDYFDCVRAVLSFLRRFDLKFHMDVGTDIPLNAGCRG